MITPPETPTLIMDLSTDISPGSPSVADQPEAANSNVAECGNPVTVTANIESKAESEINCSNETGGTVNAKDDSDNSTGRAENGNDKRKAEGPVVMVIDDDSDEEAQIPAKKRVKLDSEETKKKTTHLAAAQATLPHSVQQLQEREKRHIPLAELKIVHGVDITDPSFEKVGLSPRHVSSSPFVLPSRIPTPVPEPPPLCSTTTSDPSQTSSAGDANMNDKASTLTLAAEPESEPATVATRKDWSAGMYLDFCLSLQSSFDFQAFADKYNIPIGKVFDRFQAIVLFPVMNHSEKGKRRVTEGGRARVREWNDAKVETRKRLRREEADETGSGAV